MKIFVDLEWSKTRTGDDRKIIRFVKNSHYLEKESFGPPSETGTFKVFFDGLLIETVVGYAAAKELIIERSKVAFQHKEKIAERRRRAKQRKKNRRGPGRQHKKKK